MVEKTTWEDFRSSGLLWFVNMILHTFGMAIVFDYENGKIVDVYPARCKFRGFTEKTNTEGYERVTNFLAENMPELIEDLKS